jgi:hypothetical protein
MPHSLTYAGQPAEGFIYVMECGGYYKVGWSAVPRIRLSCIQTGNPFPVTLVGVTEGSQLNEAEWHEALKGKRVRGEWFALTDEDVSHILNESLGVDRLPDDDWIA